MSLSTRSVLYMWGFRIGGEEAGKGEVVPEIIKGTIRYRGNQLVWEVQGRCETSKLVDR